MRVAEDTQPRGLDGLTTSEREATHASRRSWGAETRRDPLALKVAAAAAAVVVGVVVGGELLLLPDC